MEVSEEQVRFQVDPFRFVHREIIERLIGSWNLLEECLVMEKTNATLIPFKLPPTIDRPCLLEIELSELVTVESKILFVMEI